MPLIGNQLASGENNSFRILDDISNFTLRFDGSSSNVVSVANNLFTLPQHPFVTGQRVTYSSGGGTTIGGIISGTAYYIIKLDQNTFRLSTTYAGSIQNTNLVSLVGTGTGITHSFNVAFDGINTKFKATYSNGTKCSISRAAQLDIAVNGVLQQPYDSNPPPNGFTIEADSTIVFSAAPSAGFTFWGKVLTNAIASFETSDNSVDTFTGNGTQVNFTLSKTPANSQNVIVTINGVVQYPSDATAARSYSVNANILSFTGAPSNGSSIQVRYIGFAVATSSSVTGFYGRTGNVVLTTSDTANIGNVYVGSATSTGTSSQPLQVTGGAYVSGSLGIGTINPGTNRIQIGVGTTSISVDSTGNISIGDKSLTGNILGKINLIGSQANTWTPSDTSNYVYQPYPNELQVINTQSGVSSSFASILLRAGQTSTDSQINAARIAAIRAAPFTTDLSFAVRTSDGNAMAERLRISGIGTVTPGSDNAQDFGSPLLRWANIYSADLQLSNEGSQNDVDGTWGKYTIQEGENDLFLINRRTGKKYKFLLEEVN